jgi:hypothetical protein
MGTTRKGPSNSRSKQPATVNGSTPKSRLDEIVDLIKLTAQAKGWTSDLEAADTTNYRYATVAVSKRGASYQEITGTFEILCDERIKISYHSTSFYNWGLSDLYDAISNEFFKLPWVKKNSPEKAPEGSSDIALIERVLRRFHLVARQLRHRHGDRDGIEIKDEYDVQDLLQAILRGLFDDVRSEEYTPSYAGGSSRVDFLLKSQKIAIEVKLASASLRDKQIGDQLIVDIGRYQSHPDCRRLICFVYDPAGNLRNPSGLEADLSRAVGKLEVKVIIVSL